MPGNNVGFSPYPCRLRRIPYAHRPAFGRKAAPRVKPLLTLTALALTSALLCPEAAFAQRSQYEEMVAKHAQANGVPLALVHRVIVRESRYNASRVGRGGTIGLMQIKLATARSLGYHGSAEGVADPD